MGTGQRRAVPSAILHGAVQRAARQQLDCAFCLRQPRDALLHRGQVGAKVHLRQQYLVFTQWEELKLNRPGSAARCSFCFYRFLSLLQVEAFHVLSVPRKSHQ